MQRIAAAVWMDLVPCLCTALGAGTVFLAGRCTAGPGRGAMGLSAGIMLGAGLFGLFLPAVQEGGWPAALAGFFLGLAALTALGPLAGRVTRKGGAAGLVLAGAVALSLAAGGVSPSFSIRRALPTATALPSTRAVMP